MLPGIGGVEYLVIAALIIIFVGPKDLPAVLRTFGRWWGKIRNFSREFRSSINEIAKETGVDDIKSKVENTNPKNFTDEMRDSINKNIIQSENQKKKMSDTNETLDEGKQPLIQHLVELRSRLIKSLILITVMFVVAYIFADTIYNFLVQPYADAVQGESGRRLIFTALHETFLLI